MVGELLTYQNFQRRKSRSRLSVLSVASLYQFVAMRNQNLRCPENITVNEEVIHMTKSYNGKQTSTSVACKASSLLRDGRSSAKTKSVAGSALSQTRPSPKKK